MDVPRGAIFGLIGPNGAGKSTTFKMLLGLLTPTSGAAEVLGWDCLTEPSHIRDLTGVVFDQDGLYNRLTAAQNLDFYARIWHLTSSERISRINTLLEQMDLTVRRNTVVDGFSRGMRQRLALARALLHSPQLLILDEPLSGLDPAAREIMYSQLRHQVRQNGITICLTTHNLAEAEKVCDQIAVMQSGRIVAQGDIGQLRRDLFPKACVTIVGSFHDTNTIELLSDTPNVASVTQNDDSLQITLNNQSSSVSPILRRLLAAGADIFEVKKKQQTLDEIYLTLLEESASE